MEFSLPMEQAARTGQASDLVFKGFVFEIIDEQWRIRNQGTGKAGAGDHDMITAVRLYGTLIL